MNILFHPERAALTKDNDDPFLTMAPPKSKLSPEVEALTAKFTTLGLSPSKALEVARNANTATSLSALMDSQNLSNSSNPQQLPSEVALLLVTLADKGKSLNDEQKTKVTQDILNKRLASADQVSGARVSRAMGTFVHSQPQQLIHLQLCL